MATNKVYLSRLPPITFRGTGGGDVLWTPQNIAYAAGRISSVWDRGAGAAPARHLWRCSTRWAATPALGDSLRLYLITSSAAATPGLADGGWTFGDAGVAAELPLLYTAVPIGAVIVGVAADQPWCNSGIITIYDRYVAIVGWNASGTKALTNTVTDHIFTFTPICDDIQAAS